MNRRLQIIKSGLPRLGVVLLLAPGPSRAAERQMVRVRIPAPVMQMKLQPLRQLPASNRLNLAIGLPLRHKPALTNLLEQLYDPASTNYHHYLTPRQFADTFGPTEGDYAKLIAFAKAHGLAVTATSPNRMLLDVNGSVSNIEKTLHVNLMVYPHPMEAGTFYAPASQPWLDLAVPVLGISGLDNYSRPRPRVFTKPLSPATKAGPHFGSGPEGTYMGNDFRAAYIPGSPLTGSGQKVGLLQFDGYTADDITNYEYRAGLPNVTLTNVLLDGFDGTPTGSGGEVEVSLDIEMAISMAPGLDSVIVYEAGPYGNWHDILNRMATDDLARQLSCSWYAPGGGPDPVADQIWQQMALQGQSFFNASGDNGAYTGPIDFPGDTPYITQVGGTTLTTSGPGGNRVSETVWNWGYGIASGGGISTSYPIPNWQTRINMSSNQGSATMRNTPDVALTADNVYVRADGTNYDAGGTSCAAPLWAGFAALINQQAAANDRAPAGFFNPAIYALGLDAGYTLGLHDIATGSNATPFSPPGMFTAVPGYDLCAGWGTPNGTNLIQALVAPDDDLRISPGLGFAASGPPGGPFAPSLQVYSLKNTGAAALNWTLVNTSAWLNASAAGGLLKPGGPVGAVTVGLDSEATNLPVGMHTATLWFTNLNSGFGQARHFILEVAYAPAAITRQPTNQEVLAGEPATFSVEAAGTRVSYHWQRNGAPLTDGGRVSGATTRTLTISNATAADADYYSVVVSNVLGAVTSSGAALAVYSLGGGQLIQNGGFETGDFSGWTISGSTNQAAVATNSLAIHSGAYGAQFGSSGVPGLLSQTLPTVPGAAYAISLWLDSPDGQSPNEFLLKWNGITLANEANLGALGWTNLRYLVTATDTNTLLQLGLQDDPSYLGLDDVTVTAYNNVASPPIIGAQPLSQTLLAGSNATFTVSATGSLPLSYVWERNGALIAGANGTTYTVNNAQLGDSGSRFSCLVSNSFGMVTSSAATLTVIAGAVNDHCSDAIMISSPDYTNIQSTLDATSDGDPVPDCAPLGNGVWYAYTAPADGLMTVDTVGSDFDTVLATYTGSCGSLVPVGCDDDSGGSLTSSLTGSVTAGTTYYILAGGYEGASGILVLHLTFSGPDFPVILAQPTNQIIAAGGAATFAVGASGAPPLNYFWKRDGAFIAGADGAAYTITNAQWADSGSRFSCLVSNVFGTATSSNALLTVTGETTNLITFDDLPDTTHGLVVPSGYHGLIWSNFYEVNGISHFAPSGYGPGTVSASNVAYNAGGYPASISATTPFNLVSACLTAAWDDNLQVEAQGYAGSALRYDSNYILSATAPTFVQFGDAGVDRVVFTSSGGTPHPGYSVSGEHFVMDNLTVEIVPRTAPVFQSVVLTNNNLVLSWSAAPGQQYQLQYTTNLASTNWTDLGGIITATNPALSLFESTGADRQRFYRILSPP